MPIWALPESFDRLSALGATRIIALSSTSVISKRSSSDRAEQELARRIAEGEERLMAWAEGRQTSWIILRPTMIYGHGRDRNVSEIVRFIRCFGFFPVLGEAKGLRQPVHVDDVACACVRALESKQVANRAYSVTGNEILSYREMVIRIFHALQKPPRLVRIPLWMFQAGVPVARALPRFRNWSAAMAERMNQDLVFHDAGVGCDLGWAPRGFGLTEADLPN